MIWAAILAALVLAAVLWPILRGRGEALGVGQEDDGPVRRWQAERARLIAQLRDNDLALAEGRLDTETHRMNAIRLGAEAEAAVAALRGARAELETGGIAPRVRPHPLLAPASLAVVAALTLGAAQMARLQDIDLTGSPHADGRVPLDVAGVMPAADAAALPPVIGSDGKPDIGAALPPVIGADGTPDIGAMVARLEARVATGEAGAEEIAMLLRSYDTLGRMDDARAVLADAVRRFPEHPDFLLGFLRAEIDAPDGADPAIALPVAERLIAQMPELLEARWYRSLLLIRAERSDEARSELMWMTPQLPADSPAARAVAELLAELAGAGE